MQPTLRLALLAAQIAVAFTSAALLRAEAATARCPAPQAVHCEHVAGMLLQRHLRHALAAHAVCPSSQETRQLMQADAVEGNPETFSCSTPLHATAAHVMRSLAILSPAAALRAGNTGMAMLQVGWGPHLHMQHVVVK